MFLEKILNLFKTSTTSSTSTTIQHPQKKIKSDFEEIKVPENFSPAPPFLSACYEVIEPNEYIGYFKNGELFNVEPRNKKIPLYEDRGIAYEARYIISDGIKYDLENTKSILSIAISNFNSIYAMPNTTHDLGYVMRMKANKENRPHIAVPLTYKAANLMMASPISWSKKDYYMIIKHLWLIGAIEYADHLLAELKSRNAFSDNTQAAVFSDYDDKSSPYYGSDLIESNDTPCVCAECAKYTKRIFSEFGYNSKYPKLPEYFKSNLDEHKYCSIRFSPVLEDISVPAWNYSGNLAKFCNRPFIDERTEEEKQQFEKHKAEREKSIQAEERYYDREYWIGEYEKHLEYQNIVDCLGDKAPKSFGGYTRMKNQNTKNFQKLKQLAEENNIKIL